MHTILYFDICSIPIFLIILITVFVRKMTKGMANRFFRVEFYSLPEKYWRAPV